MANYVFEYEHANPIGLQKFRTWKSFKQWVEGERSFWANTFGENNGDQLEDAARSHVMKYLNAVVTHANTLLENENDQNAFNNLNSLLAALYSKTDCLFNSKSIDAGFIQALSKNNGQKQAARALSLISRKTVVKNTIESEEALFSYLALKYGFDKHLSSATKSIITKLVKNYSEQQDIEFNRISDQLLKTDEQIINNEKAKKTSLKWAKSRRAYDLKENEKLHQKLHTDVGKSITELENTKQTYTEYMALKAPANYWINKSKGHRINKWLFIFLNIAFYIAAYFLLKDFIDIGVFMKTVVTVDKTVSVHMSFEEMLPLLGIRLFVVSLFVWFARVLMKLYLSEHHLQNNSKEKSIMIMTYLALLEGGQVDKEQREIMLSHIFTQSADGIVKEEFNSMAGIVGLKSTQ